MPGKEDKTNIEQNEVTEDVLEKSWNEAMDELKKSVAPEIDEDTSTAAAASSEGDDAGQPAEDLSKAKSSKKPSEVSDEDGEEDYDEEEEEDYDEEPPKGKGKGKMNKSLEDYISEDDEASIAMDVEPFLKQLVKSIDAVLNDKVKGLSLKKEIAELKKSVNVQGKALLATSQLQKSIDDKLLKFGKSPIPSSTVLRKSIKVSENKEMTKLEVMNKATELCKSGKLSTRDVITIEGRLNSGQDLPERFQDLFTEEGGK